MSLEEQIVGEGPFFDYLRELARKKEEYQNYIAKHGMSEEDRLWLEKCDSQHT
jgi:hypothetical protein